MIENDQKRIFEEWLCQYKGLLFKIVRVYAFATADQGDLFQEIAVQVWSSIHIFVLAYFASGFEHRIYKAKKRELQQLQKNLENEG